MPNLNYLQEHLGPIVSNLIDLGGSLLRWRSIWTKDIDISGTGTISTAPSAGTDIVNKAYVDSAIGGVPGNVEEVDGVPAYTGITTLRFDQADGFVLSQPGAGIARIDLVGAGGATVEDIDSNPTYGSILLFQFDQADGFVITQPIAGTARIDLAAIPDAAIAALAASKLTGQVVVANGGTNIASYTAGDLITATGATTLAVLAKGTANQVLGMNNGDTTQEYKTVTAGSNISVAHTANAITIAATNISGFQFQLIPVSATFPSANFPQLAKNVGTNWVDYTLDYDKTTGETAYWQFVIPSTVVFTTATIKIYSRQTGVTTGTAGWLITTLTRANDEAWDTAGTTDTATAATVPGTVGHVQLISKALTVTDWAAGELLLVNLTRDVAGDSANEDVKFIGATIELN